MALLVLWIDKWISFCYTCHVYYSNRRHCWDNIFIWTLFCLNKTKQINKVPLLILGWCTVLLQWQPTTMLACFHLVCCLSATPSLLVIFKLPSFALILGQMESTLKHVFGAKAHSWLASLTSGMRPVRRHQGDSSQEDVLTHHCPRLFSKGWSSMNNAVPVTCSHLANSSSSLQRKAATERVREE